MKKNKIERTGHRGVWVLVGLAAVVAVLVALAVGYSALRDLCREQCALTDSSVQLEIPSGKMVKADVLAENLGLHKGVNLAEIDFAAKRAATLAKIPNLRSLTVTRRLPNRIVVSIEERSPIARLGLCGHKRASVRVADVDGIVFPCGRDTQTLPLIRETAPGTAEGKSLSGRALAALRLVTVAGDSSLQDLNLLEVDTSKPDFLVATLGNYSIAKIAWLDMDAADDRGNPHLRRQLERLAKAVRANVADRVTVWNVTDLSDRGRVYADTKGVLP